MQFGWAEAKAAGNLAKHGVDFEDALRVFLDPRRLVAEDDRRAYGERRFRVLGVVDRRVLFVVCTWRGGVCRLLGEEGECARKTTLRGG